MHVLIVILKKKQLHDREAIHLQTIQEEKEKSETLLLNILPESIADRLKLFYNTFDIFIHFTILYYTKS